MGGGGGGVMTWKLAPVAALTSSTLTPSATSTSNRPLSSLTSNTHCTHTERQSRAGYAHNMFMNAGASYVTVYVCG